LVDEKTHNIRISVILATRNRANVLMQTLASFAKLDFATTEFLIVDNGSTDTTDQVLERWSQKFPLAFWTHEVSGKNACLNQAVKRSAASAPNFEIRDWELIPPDTNPVRRQALLFSGPPRCASASRSRSRDAPSRHAPRPKLFPRPQSGSLPAPAIPRY